MTAWLDRILERIKKTRTPSDEEEQFLHRGEVFEVLRGSEAWKLVLDYLEKLADESLTALRADRKHDPMHSMCLQLRWQEREQVLRMLQEEVLSTAEERKRLMQENKTEDAWLSQTPS